MSRHNDDQGDPDRPVTASRRSRAMFALGVGERQPHGSCPAPEAILAWHEQTLSATEADKVETHVAHCDSCFAIWTGLMRLNEEAQSEVAPDAATETTPADNFVARLRRSMANTGGKRTFALAASLVLAGFLGLALLNYGSRTNPFPVYELDARGELSYRGGENTTTLTVNAGSLLRLVLTPETAPDEPVEMRVYTIAGDVAQEIRSDAQVSDDGVAWIEGVVGTDIVLPSGTTGMLVVIGRPGLLPAATQIHEIVSDVSGASSPLQTEDWTAWKLQMDTRE